MRRPTGFLFAAEYIVLLLWKHRKVLPCYQTRYLTLSNSEKQFHCSYIHHKELSTEHWIPDLCPQVLPKFLQSKGVHSLKCPVLKKARSTNINLSAKFSCEWYLIISESLYSLFIIYHVTLLLFAKVTKDIATRIHLGKLNLQWDFKCRYLFSGIRHQQPVELFLTFHPSYTQNN